MIYAVMIGVSCGVPGHPMYDAVIVHSDAPAEEVGKAVLDWWPNEAVIINQDDMPEDEYGNVMWLESVKEVPLEFAVQVRDIMNIGHYTYFKGTIEPA